MSDIRGWLAVHFPDALPWQADYAEAMMAAHREGRRLVITRPMRSGQASARAMAEAAQAALAEPGGTP